MLGSSVDWGGIAGRLAAASDAGTEDEAWRAIWQTDLGFPIRTLPDRPEVTILWQQPSAHEARLLSVASPEPLFATPRTVLALERRRRRIVLTPSGPQVVVSWVEVAHRLVRALDGTRALLVPVDPAGQPMVLVAGQYRLKATYRLTGVAGLADLSRQGDPSDESAVWDFTVPVVPSPIVDPEA
jgi:hypothetical protein